ncbi:uncharacterized protein LOC125179198 [Hyalella azteca]|uniref:Uncharacterized protein LOC125179198 n=1 Tax=Hyalella azteca TaxID=294128 RepID=A0A979FTM6_HYAAZ|nr:uncharacterized protein LOC125179198 [Hyalella azteca]
MSLFMVRYSGFQELNNSTPRTITVTVLLESLYGGFLLSIFMPVGVITAIGVSTLLYAFENFQDRIAVTLSCLIVLAGLYSQICVVIPISAAPKFVDAFFFYAILRMYLVCTHHLGVYRWLISFKNRKALNLERRSAPAMEPNKNPSTAAPTCIAPLSPLESDLRKKSVSHPGSIGEDSSERGRGFEDAGLIVEKCFFKSNLIMPMDTAHQAPAAHEVSATDAYPPPDKICNMNPFNACLDNEETDKKFDATYKRFTVASYLTVASGIVFDLTFFGLSAYFISKSRQAVFSEYPSVTLNN